MKGEGFTLKRRGPWGTGEATGPRTLYSAVIELLDHGPPDAAAAVRPVVMDSIFDWMPPIEAALESEPGARIGVAGSDALLAARVACDAAGWIAERGKRVILVDGSIESPVVRKALPEDGDEGLVDIILFGVSPSVAVRRTLAPGVFLLTAGSHAMSASAILASEAFRSVASGLSADAVVLIVLPSGLLPFALAGLSSVLAVERTADGLSAIASFLSEINSTARPPAVGVLVGEPERDIAQAHERREEAPAPPDVERPDVAREEPIATARAEIDDAPPDRAPVVLTEAAGDALRDAEAFTPPPDFTRGEVILSAGEDRRPRRRRVPLAFAVVLVVALAAVGVWRVTGTRHPLPAEGKRGTSAGAAKRTGKPAPPARDEQGRPPGQAEEQAVPGGTGAETEQEADGGASTVTTAEGRKAGPGKKLVAGPGGPYTVFLSSHRVESAAGEDAEAALSLGVESEVIPTEVGDTGTWYRVAVHGGYATLTEARSVLDVVKTLGYGGAWIERSREGG